MYFFKYFCLSENNIIIYLNEIVNIGMEYMLLLCCSLYYLVSWLNGNNIFLLINWDYGWFLRLLI